MSAEPDLRLGDLMDKDPLLLNDAEVDAIVAALRQAFGAWQAEESKAAMNEKRPKVAAGISKDKAKQLSLDDLLGGE